MLPAVPQIGTQIFCVRITTVPVEAELSSRIDFPTGSPLLGIVSQNDPGARAVRQIVVQADNRFERVIAPADTQLSYIDFGATYFYLVGAQRDTLTPSLQRPFRPSRIRIPQIAHNLLP